MHLHLTYLTVVIEPTAKAFHEPSSSTKTPPTANPKSTPGKDMTGQELHGYCLEWASWVYTRSLY